MKIITWLLPVLLVWLLSCSKDQKVVKELEGLWYVTSYTMNNSPATPPGTNMSFNFTKCKVKKGDCDGSLTVNSITLPLTYRIGDKGTTYTITCSVPGVIPTQSGTITEHSSEKMVLTSVMSGDTYVTVLSRNSE